MPVKGNFVLHLYDKDHVLILLSDPISVSMISWLNGLPQLLKKLGCTSLETSLLIYEVLIQAAAKNMLSMLDCLAEQLFSKL